MKWDVKVTSLYLLLLYSAFNTLHSQMDRATGVFSVTGLWDCVYHCATSLSASRTAAQIKCCWTRPPYFWTLSNSFWTSLHQDSGVENDEAHLYWEWTNSGAFKCITRKVVNDAGQRNWHSFSLHIPAFSNADRFLQSLATHILPLSHGVVCTLRR